MAGSSKEQNSRLQIRSFSLPCKTDLINKRIEQELERLRTKEALSTSLSDKISTGLSGLSDLYSCINQVLSLPLTQQSLSLRQHEKHVVQLLNGCSKLQNICTTTREIVLQQKKLAIEIQSEVQMQQNEVSSYMSSRKEVIKRAKGLMLTLKQLVNDDSLGSSSFFLGEEDRRLSTIIKALTCVSIISISVYESLLLFVSIPVSKPKSGLFVSKLVRRSGGKSGCQTKTGNELMDVDIALHSLCSGVEPERVHIAQKRLEELVAIMERMEGGLDSAYLQLTETKACLMKIVSF